ncbi:MAG: DUF4738 domain-containing protein [Bacteroidaceae bacterium]|nr:DUF4738 domain-containing protein [Bacteroidaceae bacterium]
MMNKNIVLFAVAFIMASCGHRYQNEVNDIEILQQDTDALRKLQGIWIDGDTEEPIFRISNDSIYYPDSTILPQQIRVVSDTLYVGQNAYAIESLSENVFSFHSMNGELIRVCHTEQVSEDSLAFVHPMSAPIIYTEVTKRDTVINYSGRRYHCYIAINPSTKKIYRTSYTSEGVAVQNFYFDNLIHVSVYSGKNRIFGRNITKSTFENLIPEQFLSQATLSDMKFSNVDKEGFHFDANVCIPDGAACYMVDITISFDGDVDYHLMDF